MGRENSKSHFLQRIRYCVNIPILLFVVALFCFNEVYSNHFFVLICLAIFTLFCFNLGVKANIKLTLLIILFFQIVSISTIILGDVVDAPDDCITYKNIAIGYLIDGNDYIIENTLDSADWGYSFIIGVFYDFFGIQLGFLMLSFFKIFIHLCTCILIYLIGIDLYDKGVSRIIVLLWGLNLGSVYWNTAFLKEGIFCFIIIVAIFGLYKYYKISGFKRYGYLLLFIIFTVLSAFFREIMPLFFIITFILFSFFKRLSTRYLGIIILGILLLTYVATELIAYLIPAAAGGFIQREESFSGGIMALLNIVNPFLCPYPTLDILNNQTTNIQVAVFASYNIVLSYFVIMGLIYCIKNKLILLYPFIFILMLNSIMLIAYGFSMNYRYIYITSPLAFILMPYGNLYYKKKFFFPYVLIITVITLMYNLR